jgi:hypothetical protein
MKKPIFWDKSYLLERQNGHQSFLKYQDACWVDFQLAEISEHEHKKAPTIIFSKDKASFTSPFRASFGGIHLGEELKTNSAELVKKLNAYLSLNQTRHAKITLHPSHMNSTQFVNEQAYLQNAWEILHENINHYVDMGTWSEDCMSKGNRKKLRQCHGSGLMFSEATRLEWIDAYEVVKKNRESLGSRVSMSGIEIFALLTNYPDIYKCFILKDHFNQIAAAAFLVETSYENIYVYLWADVPEFRNLSPIVLLMTQLVSTFREKYNFLDLGTSAINGEVLEGLSRFKDNLGALPSHKLQIAWQS